MYSGEFNASPINGTQLSILKNQLLGEKQKIINKSKSSDSFCLDKNELSDVLDEASINIQTSQELRFRNREIFYLKKISRALDNIENGTYGHCQECDALITFERLKARPTAELCIHCKEESEFSENNNINHKRSKSLGKTLYELAGR